jgi:tight adherence protein B
VNGGVLFLLCAAATAFLFGAVEIVGAATFRRNIGRFVLEDPSDARRIDAWDRRFGRTGAGRNLQRQLVQAGIDTSPLVVFAGSVGIGSAAAWVLWTFLAPVFALAGVAVGVLSARLYVGRGRDRRREAFIGQMPAIARVLANAVNAGLSTTAAVSIAADELDDPARSELRLVADRLRFGSSLDDALDEMSSRIGSREVAVLASTLVICARSGGSLVSSLRDIAATLEDRKETRREVRTTLSQALATGYLVIAMGVGILFLLNVVQPGTVDKMTASIYGQVALVAATGLFATGIMVIRRITRIEP